MASEPIDDVVAWSKTQARWRQDCLRRLAIADDLKESDEAILLGMIKHAAISNGIQQEPIRETIARPWR